MNPVMRTIVIILALLLTTAGMAATAGDVRQSRTSEGRDIVRGSVGDGTVSNDEYVLLQTDGTRSKNRTQSAQRKGSGLTIAQSVNTEFWFYDVDVELFTDQDRDGYFQGIDLWFDADTIYTAADVYAVIYLSFEYGPWNEYAATDNFALLGSVSTDDYTVETELVSGYPTGSYDILIELYDAFDDTLVATIGPDETSELALLPLEDSTRDAAVVVVEPHVVVTEGGGALGALFLLGLLAVRMTLRPQAARLSK